MQPDGQRAQSLTCDITQGHEPVCIPLVGLSEDQVERLQSFEYIADSVYGPEPISRVSRGVFYAVHVADETGDVMDQESAPNSSDSEDSDSDSSSDGPWGCSCLEADPASAESINTCDCIASFGHFYATDRAASNTQRLLLEALPPKLPLVECSDACACSSSCRNRPSQRGVQLPLAVQSTSSGLGLFYTPTSQAKHDLLSGTFISLYAGEYLCTDQARQRWAAQAEHPAGEGNYILSLRLPNETIHIDPRYKGNIGRFLNHSCEPNCAIHVVRWGPDAVSRAAMFTKKTVRPGVELTFDYGDASGAGDGIPKSFTPGAQDDVNRTPCLCASTNCRGWMPYDPTL